MRIFPIFLLILSTMLTACSLPGTQSEGSDILGNEDATVVVETDAIKIVMPKTWSPVKPTDMPNPRIGSTELAYASSDAKYGFANNIVILKDELMNIMTSKKYSEINNIQTTKNYLEYTKLRDEDFTFSDDEASRLYVFEARYNVTTPRMKFIQVARVCGKKVYLLHVSLTLDKNPENYIPLLKTFSCK